MSRPVSSLFDPSEPQPSKQSGWVSNILLGAALGVGIGAGAFGYAWQTALGRLEGDDLDRTFVTLVVMCLAVGWLSAFSGAPLLWRSARRSVSPWIAAALAVWGATNWFQTLVPQGYAAPPADSPIWFFSSIGIGVLLMTAVLALMDWRIDTISRRATRNG